MTRQPSRISLSQESTSIAGVLNTRSATTYGFKVPGVSYISAYDNETGTIIAQNDASNAYNPDLWSRFDWEYVADKLWYCQTAYAAESEEAALATEAADATNPAEEGCGGFSWTRCQTKRSKFAANTAILGVASTPSPRPPRESVKSSYISQFDNDAKFIIAQNEEENAYNPGPPGADLIGPKSTEISGIARLRTRLNQEEAALATEAADAMLNPAEEGCGGFSWTQLVDALEIRGEYGDSWGGEHTITQTAWVSGSSSYAISQFDNEQQFIIAQNGEDNAYNPSLWSRFDWAKVDFKFPGIARLRMPNQKRPRLRIEAADATNPAEEGCGGFSWTQLVDALEIRGEYGDSGVASTPSPRPLGKWQLKLMRFRNSTTNNNLSSLKMAKTMRTIQASGADLIGLKSTVNSGIARLRTRRNQKKQRSRPLQPMQRTHPREDVRL